MASEPAAIAGEAGAGIEPVLRFGPAGVPRDMEGASHLEGLREVARRGLRAMELAFVHQVNIKEKDAPTVRAAAADLGVALSVHAPYYINLNSADGRKLAASKERILKAARIGALCGATHIIFHAGWRHDSDPEALYRQMRDHVAELARRVADEGLPVFLSPETTGKATQFGDLDELLRIAQDVPGVRICLDFAHLHARHGNANTEEEFDAILDTVQAELGVAALSEMHMHVSGIAYGAHGEVRHLKLEESDLDYRALMRVLARRRVGGRVICESPDNAADALLLNGVWHDLACC